MLIFIHFENNICFPIVEYVFLINFLNGKGARLGFLKFYKL